MKGKIYNRNEFLKKISQQLNRDSVLKNVERPEWSYSPQHKVLKEANTDQLLEVFKKQCVKINTQLIMTNQAELGKVLKQTIHAHGGGPVIKWKDERFRKWGLTTLFNRDLMKDKVTVHEWDPSISEENVQFAEQANIGITISDITLAESGTAVLFSSNEHGRTVSFLPSKSIILIPKSSIVPRMTQAAEIIRKEIKSGKMVASCINFITGPSNSADIEMNLVVGVHGPMDMTYIVMEDL